MSAKVQIVLGSSPEKPTLKIITLNGEIDETNLSELKEIVDPLIINEDCQAICLNLKGLKFINSMVISYFTNIYTKLMEKNKKILFLEANDQILDILDLVGLTTIIANYTNLEDMLKAAEEG